MYPQEQHKYFTGSNVFNNESCKNYNSKYKSNNSKFPSFYSADSKLKISEIMKRTNITPSECNVESQQVIINQYNTGCSQCGTTSNSYVYRSGGGAAPW